MEKFTESNLKTLINETITAKDDGGSQVSLKIKSVKGGLIKGIEWDGFNVTLEGDESFHIPQGTYSFFHEAFGKCRLFMVPNSPTEYEIIVSRRSGEMQ